MHAIAGGEDDDVDVRRRRAVIKLHPGGGEARHVRSDHHCPADHPVRQLVVDRRVLSTEHVVRSQRVAGVVELWVKSRFGHQVEQTTRNDRFEEVDDTTHTEKVHREAVIANTVNDPWTATRAEVNLAIGRIGLA